MGDGQGDGSMPLSDYWIDGPSVYQSGQLEEVGRNRQGDSQKDQEDFWWSRGQSIRQNFIIDLGIPVCGHTGSDAGSRSVTIKIALSFHPAFKPF